MIGVFNLVTGPMHMASSSTKAICSDIPETPLFVSPPIVASESCTTTTPLFVPSVESENCCSPSFSQEPPIRVSLAAKDESSSQVVDAVGVFSAQAVFPSSVPSPPSLRDGKKQARHFSKGSIPPISVAGKRKVNRVQPLVSQGLVSKKSKAMAEAGSQPRLPQ
jgi:hypothetical protein